MGSSMDRDSGKDKLSNIRMRRDSYGIFCRPALGSELSEW
jgi:hypothetical protein